MDRRKLWGQAAIAMGRYGSSADWPLGPKLEPGDSHMWRNDPEAPIGAIPGAAHPLGDHASVKVTISKSPSEIICCSGKAF
jgi:hypothetical protein